MKNLGLAGEELNAVIEYSTVPGLDGSAKEGALTNEELDDLAHDKLTIRLLVKARRVLALIERDKDRKNTVKKEDLNLYATRSELKPIEEAVESGGLMLFALFLALKKKGFLTEDVLKEAVKAASEGEITWEG